MIFMLFRLLLFCQTAFSQQDWSIVYRDIEEYNIELQSLRHQIEIQKMTVLVEHQPENIQLDGFYLQPNNSIGTPYTELQVTQPIEFPLIYKEQKIYRKIWDEKLHNRYEKKRQEILWQAEQYLLEMVYLSKKIELEKERFQLAKKKC